MPAAKEPQAFIGALREREAHRWDAIRGGQGGGEDGYEPIVEIHDEEAEHRRFMMVGAEAADKGGVGQEAAPARADKGSAGKGRGKRREAEQDLQE